MPEAKIYRYSMRIYKYSMRYRVPVLDQSDCSICYNHDLIVFPRQVTTAQSLMRNLMQAYKEWASEASSLLVEYISIFKHNSAGLDSHKDYNYLDTCIFPTVHIICISNYLVRMHRALITSEIVMQWRKSPWYGLEIPCIYHRYGPKPQTRWKNWQTRLDLCKN